MLIYKNDGTLHCISEKTLKLAGYRDVTEFLEDHKDFSELFVKKPGYIYNFENFSWLSFLRNANPEQKRVLIATRDNATYECELDMERVLPTEFDENTPEFYFQIEFKNLRLVSGSAAAAEESAEEPAFGEVDLDRDLIDRAYETFEGAEAAPADTKPSFTKETPAEASESVTFKTPVPETVREEPPLFEAFEEEPAETTALSFDAETTQAAPETPEPAAVKNFDEPLDLVDFSLENEEERKEESEEKPEEAPALSLDDAFAALGTPQQSREEAQPAVETPSAAPGKEAAPPAGEKEIPAELPDTRRVAGILGLPETMVKAFVKEFVETYYTDLQESEAALESGHLHLVKNEAIKLKGIAANLMMEPLVATLEEILSARGKEAITSKWREVGEYMQALARVYAPEHAVPEKPAETPQPETTQAPETAEAPETSAPAPEEESAAAAPSSESGRSLHLVEEDRGETILFDPGEAADALGLPESLIIEFVNDFVVQAREEKSRFEKAFEAGDIQTVNQTAHKLKGVAANLRIEDMRELMEKAQHAQTLEEAETYLTAFYRKLAALRNTMAKEFA
ncbi:Hpt domain-containing protein [Hydrogenimonas sp. SS33]|uniref:Hpt domain-containing protein n=1 Tax=Hydrogenimonas leucolamina TaxID=2954236 RepID=UPI00336C09BD